MALLPCIWCNDWKNMTQIRRRIGIAKVTFQEITIFQRKWKISLRTQKFTELLCNLIFGYVIEFPIELWMVNNFRINEKEIWSNKYGVLLRNKNTMNKTCDQRGSLKKNRYREHRKKKKQTSISKSYKKKKEIVEKRHSPRPEGKQQLIKDRIKHWRELRQHDLVLRTSTSQKYL